MIGDTVTLAHGAGGKQTSELIDRVFKKHFSNPHLTADDAAVLTLTGNRIAVSTDGFVVSPAFFPGGNIGKLSICGTVNDLACMGARPLYLTCAFVVEEGFPMEKLEEIAAAMEKTAAEAGVCIVAGDTKVAGKGQVDGVFITTTGIGLIEEGINTSGTLAKPGDAILVTGDIGRHGCTILLARDEYGIEADVVEEEKTVVPVQVPVPVQSLSCQKNVLIQKILSEKGVDNEKVNQVASIVSKHIEEKNHKQVIYRAITSKFGQQEGLDLYTLIKKSL